MRLPSNPLSLMGPAILFVFAVCFLLFWFADRERRYLLALSAAILLFCLASLSQMLAIPAGAGANAVISAAIYMSSVILTCEALLSRSHRHFPVWYYIVCLTAICCGVAYFFYVERNLVARIYILNFGIGILFATTVFRLRHLRRGRTAEKILFLSFFAFTVQFFIRTAFTTQRIQDSATGLGFSAFWFTLQFSLAVFGVTLALSILAVVVTDKLSSLEKEKATDHLSGLLNRRGFGDAAARIFRLRPSGPIGILLLDIDHFKRINDRYGHHAGDLVIGGVARLIAEMTSSVDGVSCRLGGEEFAILLPDKDGQRSAMFAERIRSAIEQQKFDTGQRNLSVTVSVGVHARSHPASLQQLLDRADEALYRAKRHGRNRVEEL